MCPSPPKKAQEGLGLTVQMRFVQSSEALSLTPNGGGGGGSGLEAVGVGSSAMTLRGGCVCEWGWCCSNNVPPSKLESLVM